MAGKVAVVFVGVDDPVGDGFITNSPTPDHQDSGLRFLGPLIGSKTQLRKGPGDPDSHVRTTRPIRFWG
jgi:hypothetical protein